MKLSIDYFYDKLFSAETKKKAERSVLYVAIGSFFLHLLVILLINEGLITLPGLSEKYIGPIAATYTPFSFILIYEVYLLVYYLPKSMTTYIGEQYEIITLIVIRRLFKDLSSLELTSDWFQNPGDLQFTYDIVASLILFYLIYLFYKVSRKKDREEELNDPKFDSYRKIKKVIAILLVPVIVFYGLYTFLLWFIDIFSADISFEVSLKDINTIFFDEFFFILILVDIVLLLFSYLHTDKFYKVIRNSGFIISTILIRLSFTVTGLMNIVLILAAVAFGIIILWIHNQYEKGDVLQDGKTI